MRSAKAIYSPKESDGSGVDLYQLSMGPLDCIRGRHALDGFGVLVDEDVFGDRFRRRPARRAGIAGKPAAAHRGVKRQHYRIDLPQRVVSQAFVLPTEK